MSLFAWLNLFEIYYMDNHTLLLTMLIPSVILFFLTVYLSVRIFLLRKVFRLDVTIFVIAALLLKYSFTIPILDDLYYSLDISLRVFVDFLVDLLTVCSLILVVSQVRKYVQD